MHTKQRIRCTPLLFEPANTERCVCCFLDTARAGIMMLIVMIGVARDRRFFRIGIGCTIGMSCTQNEQSNSRLLIVILFYESFMFPGRAPLCTQLQHTTQNDGSRAGANTWILKLHNSLEQAGACERSNIFSPGLSLCSRCFQIVLDGVCVKILHGTSSA